VWAGVLLLLAVAGLSKPASAQHASQDSERESQVDDLTNRARDAVDEGRFDDAVGLYEKAAKLEPSPRWTIELAEAHAGAGRLLQAKSVLEEALSTTEDMNDRAVLQDALHTIQGRIPVVRLTVHGPALWAVTLEVDGTDTPSAINGRIEVDPGRHVLRAAAEGHRSLVKEIDAVEGKTHSVSFALARKATPETPDRPPPAPPEWRRPVAYASFAVASAGLVAGTLFYRARASAKDEADNLFTVCNRRGCSSSERSTIDQHDADAARYGNFALVGLVAAVAGTGTGLWLLRADKLERRSEQTTTPTIAWRPGVTTMQVSGSF